MLDKSWYESKTVWGALLIGAGLVYTAVTDDEKTGLAVIGIGASLFGIGIRDAI